ncbi:MAG: DUF1877 family protein [Acidobacteriota bacterium]
MRKSVYGKTCSLRSVSDVAELRVDPQALKVFLAAPSQVDIHFYWQALTYLLTGISDGGAEPLCYLFKGGETIGQNEMGEVRYLNPEQVARFNAAIANISPDDFGEELYDLKTLDANHIYPERWQADGEDNDLLSNIRELYFYLQLFIKRTAEQGKGAVIAYQNTELYFEDED